MNIDSISQRIQLYADTCNNASHARRTAFLCDNRFNGGTLAALQLARQIENFSQCKDDEKFNLA